MGYPSAGRTHGGHDATILSVDHWPVPARCLQKTQQFMDPLQSEREILELKFLPLYRIFNKGWFIYNLFIYVHNTQMNDIS